VITGLDLVLGRLGLAAGERQVWILSRLPRRVELPGHTEAILDPAEARAPSVVAERHQHLPAFRQSRKGGIDLLDVIAHYV
jgi:hypothetical protein